MDETLARGQGHLPTLKQHQNVNTDGVFRYNSVVGYSELCHKHPLKSEFQVRKLEEP